MNWWDMVSEASEAFLAHHGVQPIYGGLNEARAEVEVALSADWSTT